MTDLPQGPTAHAVSDVPAPQVPVPDVLVSARGLEVHFPVRSGGALRRTTGVLRAVDGVDLDIRRGETLGLGRSEKHTSELQSRQYLVCRLLLEKTTAQSMRLPRRTERRAG